MSHTSQLLKDLERSIAKTHEGLLDMLHAIGQIHALESEFVHTVDGLAEVETSVHVTTETEQTETQPAAPQPTPEPQPEPEPLPEPAPEPAADPEVTLEDVRPLLAKIARTKGGDVARGLLKNHGAHKLSEVDPTKFAALRAAAEEVLAE